MASHAIPKRNTAGRIIIPGLRSKADPTTFQVNPTIAEGDFKVSIDGGAFANLATLPVVMPAGGKAVAIDWSAAEANSDNTVIEWSDASGAEWCDDGLTLQPSAMGADDFASQASVNTIDDFLDTEMAAVHTAVTSGTHGNAALKTLIDAMDNFVDTEIADIQARLPAALVGGRMDANMQGAATGVIARATFAADTGLQTIRSGTAQGGNTGYITLDSGASSINDFYVGCRVVTTGGTGAGQARVIVAYNGSSKAASVSRLWTTAPETGTTFSILPGSVNADLIQLDTPTNVIPSVSTIAFAVWDDNVRTLTSIDEDSTTLDLDATIRAAVGLASANLDTQLGDLPTNADLATSQAAADDATLAAIAALSIPTAAQNAAGLLDLANGVETDVTLRQFCRAIGAICAGIVTGAGTGTEVFKALAAAGGGTTRVTVTVDSSGNRSAVTLNL